MNEREEGQSGYSYRRSANGRAEEDGEGLVTERTSDRGENCVVGDVSESYEIQITRY